MLEKILKQCYDEETVDTKSTDNIKTAVLSRIEEDKPMKRKLNKKAILIPAIAATLILATTCVAGANGWNLKTAIGDLFDEDNRDDSAFFGYDINGIGRKKLDQTFERDGYTVNMVGVLADKYTTYLFYDLVVEEGHVFSAEDFVGNKYSETYTIDDTAEVYLDFEDESFITIDKNSYKAYKENTDGTFRRLQSHLLPVTMLISQEGNVYHYATRFDFMPASLVNEEMTFELGGLSINSDNFDPLFEICEPFTVSYDFITESDERLIDVCEPFEFDGENFMLENVDLTPFSLVFRISQDLETGTYWDNEELRDKFGNNSNSISYNVKLTFKDGTTTNEEMLFKDGRYGGGSYMDSAYPMHVSDDIHLMWARPVNVDDIESITIGDTTFTLD